MRSRCHPCLVALALLAPSPSWGQAAADEARRDQEMQEDVEVLRRIMTESVQQVYQRADERVTRTCATCHAVQSMDLMMLSRHIGATGAEGWSAGDLNAVHSHWARWAGSHEKQPSGHGVSGLANYVAGHGIVVQMEAPAPIVDRDVKPFVEADEAALKRWEVLLREMRGDREKDPPAKPIFVPPQHRRVHRLILTEKVVEALAENGRNLRHLGPEEHVTIAFTFRTPSREEREAERRTLLRHYFPNASAQPSTKTIDPQMGAVNSDAGLAGAIDANQRAANAAKAGFSNPLGETPQGPRSVGPAGEIGGGGPRTTGNAGGGAGLGPRPMALEGSLSTRTSAVAGDLLLRQERYAEAVAAYEKALKEAGVNLADQKAPLPADAAEMVRKLVQAHVGAKNVSQATTLLQWLERSQASSSDEMQALRRMYLDLAGVPPKPDDVKAYLNDTRPNRRELLLERLLAETPEDGEPGGVPARMTISCTRKQLDEVAAGKLSKLDFAGKVSLKYSKASAPAGKKNATKN